MKLQPIAGERGLYVAQINGKQSVVCYTARNRSKAEFANNSITFPHLHIGHAKRIGTEKGMPVYVACLVTVADKFNQSWVIALDVFNKTKSGESDFNLSGKAREAYVESKGFQDEKFEIVVAESKPELKTQAPKPGVAAQKADAKAAKVTKPAVRKVA